MSFLFDEQISPRIPNALREIGQSGIHVYDVDGLGRGAADALILPYCGKAGLTLVTLDRRMLESPHLHALIHEHDVGVFFVASENRKQTPPPWMIFKALVRQWDEMKRIAASESRPFMKLVKPGGRITSVGWKPAGRRKRRRKKPRSR